MLQLTLGIALRRVLVAIPTLVLLSLVVFVVLRLLPVDPLSMMLPTRRRCASRWASTSRSPCSS